MRARNTAAKMLMDRGYTVAEVDRELTEEEVEHRLRLREGQGHLDFVAEHPRTGRKMWVWFYEPNSPQRNRPMNLALLRETVADCIRKCGTPDEPMPESVDVILVLGPDDEKNVRGNEEHIHKEDFAFRNRVELFWCKELAFPINDHILQSRTQVVTSAEREELHKVYAAEARDFPRFRHKDMLVRYFHLSSGQLVRVDRPDGRTMTYRYVE